MNDYFGSNSPPSAPPPGSLPTTFLSGAPAAPGTAGASGAPVGGTTTVDQSQQTGLNPSATRTGTIVDNRIIPGSGGFGPLSADGSGSNYYGFSDSLNSALNSNPSASPLLPQGSPMQTAYSMQNQLLQMTSDQVMALQQQMVQAGFINPTAKTFSIGAVVQGDETYNAFNNLISQAYRTKTDWSAILNQNIQDNMGNPNSQGYKRWTTFNQQIARANSPVTSTDTSSSSMLTDPTTAQGVLYKAMQSELHRGPTQDEIAQFTSMLQSTENANPNVTTATTVRDPTTGLPVRSSTATKTGIDSYRFPEYAALNYAHTGAAGVEANTTKVATDYMQAAIDATRPAGGADLTATHGGA